MKEKNLWSDEDEKWNNQRIERLNTLLEGWENFLNKNNNLNDEDFKTKWLEERKLLLAKFLK